MIVSEQIKKLSRKFLFDKKNSTFLGLSNEIKKWNKN